MDKTNLLMLANRGLSLNGTGYRGGLYRNPASTEYEDLDTQNREFLRSLASAPTDLNPRESDSEEIKESKRALKKLMEDAIDGDRQAMRSLNAIRLETVDNFVKATSNFMSFFEVTTLRDDERPYVQNTTFNEIQVSYLSQDGRPRRVKVEVDVLETPIDLRYISSRKVGYRTLDIYKGNISQIAQRTFDIGFDVRQQIDNECYKLLTLALGSGGAYGEFSFSGQKASRIYVPHSSIDTSHLPTTNDITVKRRKVSDSGQVIWLKTNDTAANDEDDADINGFFGVPVLQDIIRYADSWGSIFPDGRLRPTGEVLVPSSDIFDILFGIGAIGVNLSDSEIQRQIQTQGYTGFAYGGINWRFVPEVTIPSGTCYPKFNKLPGRFYLKPGLDKEFVDTDRERNWEERSQQKVIGLYIINQKRLNTARFTYKD